MNQTIQEIDFLIKKAQFENNINYLASMNPTLTPIQNNSYLTYPNIIATPQTTIGFQDSFQSQLLIQAQLQLLNQAQMVQSLQLLQIQQKMQTDQQMALSLFPSQVIPMEENDKDGKKNGSSHFNYFYNQTYSFKPFNPTGDLNHFLNSKTERSTSYADDKSPSVTKPIPFTPKMLINEKTSKTKLFKIRQFKSKRKNQKQALMNCKCGHKVCGLVCKTHKQIIAHHVKMNPECQKDSTFLLKAISKLKVLIHELLQGNILDKSSIGFNEKYEEIMKTTTLKEYAQLLCGLTMHDKCQEEEDNQDVLVE